MSPDDDIVIMRRRYRLGWWKVGIEAATFSINAATLVAYLLNPAEIDGWAFLAAFLVAAMAALLGWDTCQLSWRRMIIKCYDEAERGLLR